MIQASRITDNAPIQMEGELPTKQTISTQRIETFMAFLDRILNKNQNKK